DARRVILEPPQKRGAQTGFMRTAIWSRYGVAIRVKKTVSVHGPGHSPFDRPVSARLAGRACEDVGMHQRCAAEIGGEVVFQSIGEMEPGFLGDALHALEQCFVAMPSDFHSAIEIGFRARHFEYALGSECGLRPENIRVRLEPHTGATAVWCATGLFQLAFRL